jgi:hypothetical protein
MTCETLENEYKLAKCPDMEISVCKNHSLLFIGDICIALFELDDPWARK